MMEDWEMEKNCERFQSNKYWSTSNEMDYAQSLVNDTVFRLCPHKRQIPLKQILQNYVKSAKQRIKCDTYVPDGEIIIAYVEDRIAEL